MDDTAKFQVMPMKNDIDYKPAMSVYTHRIRQACTFNVFAQVSSVLEDQ